jgi:hypothetical protein
MTECQECSIHKAFHDVAMAEKRMAEFQLNEARARCEKLRELADMAAAEQGLAQRRMMEAQRERDEARAALADAYRRGAEDMRKAAAKACDDEAVSHRQSGRMTDEYRAFGAYLAAARVEALPIPEDQ